MSALSDQIDQIIRKYRLPFSIGEGNSAIARVLVNKDGEVVYDADNPPDPAPPGVLDFISLFDPTRTQPIALSMPWITELAAPVAGEMGNLSNMQFHNMNFNVVRLDNLVSIATGWEILFEDTELTEVHFPKLTTMNGAIQIGENGYAPISLLDFSNLATMTPLGELQITLGSAPDFVISFPKLTQMFLIQIEGDGINPIVGSVEFPLLTDIPASGELSLQYLNLADLNGLSALRTVQVSSNNYLSNNLQLSDISALYNLTLVAGSLNLQGNAISSAAVDAFLNALAAHLDSGSASGSINLSGQTPAAPPTSASAAALAYLQGLGMTITTD